jgi:GTP-binding protein HflX
VHELERIDVRSEAAILVGVILPQHHFLAEPLAELEGLAQTARVKVRGRLLQKRNAPNNSTYLGRGKVEELTDLVDREEANVVLFDNELTPAQRRNLENRTGVKVLDRTELILDIFSTRAQTYEARLAVELAQLEYALPRLKRMWTHLSRLNMGVGMRGPGEKQLEVDRRLVVKRIHDLRSELRVIEKRKERQVSARRDHMTVSLVGYTNAGKSTLLNVLTEAGVKAEDQLFATLDTRTRRWQLPHWGPVLLSDTVGFIRNLPHRLIASFKATLEEARQADLLLHVADASHPNVHQQISAVVEVLEEVGIEAKNTVLALNKMDAPGAQDFVGGVLNRYPHAVPISACTGAGLLQLSVAVSDALSHSFHNIDVETSVGDGKLMAYLAAHGEILSRRFTEDRVTIHCRLPQEHLGRIRKPGVMIKERPGNGTSVVDKSTPDIETAREDVA